MSQYPPRDSERDAADLAPESGAREQATTHSAPSSATSCRAVIAAVEEGSPAYDAGFEPGCVLTAVDGQPLRDVIDWRWLSSGDEIEVAYIDLDGDEGTVELWREPGERWGFEFDGLVFDGVKQCRNACTFCFMHQLPRGMRRSLYLRDDDFRLSFLVGTFVTLTNLAPADEARIVEQRISPLRVSLQVSNPAVRARLIGKHAQHGIDALERLLAAGIEFHAQIVLVPGENDGAVLEETLAWAYARPGILNIGIVPLGYTCHQRRFDHSFNDEAQARAVLDLVAPFQERALRERGHAWVFAADEFYRNAHRDDVLAIVPGTAHYGDFSLFEDGIGIIRSTVDDWEEAARSGFIAACAAAAEATGTTVRMVAGFAQQEFLDALIARSGIGGWFRPLYVRNDFFGGNVDVTGLLTAHDIIRTCLEHRPGPCSKWNTDQVPVPNTQPSWNRDQVPVPAETGAPAAPAAPGVEGSLSPNTAQGFVWQPAWNRDLVPVPEAESSWNRDQVPVPDMLVVVPRVIFNDDGLTLDDYTRDDMEKEAGIPLPVVSCSPLQYFPEITALLTARASQ